MNAWVIRSADQCPDRGWPSRMGVDQEYEAVRWFPVEDGGPEQVRRYPDRTLFLCWPPYDTPMAHLCLQVYEGRHVLYIGEDRGCTADEAFHDLLENDFIEVEQIGLPQFWGIHDYLGVWERR